MKTIHMLVLSTLLMGFLSACSTTQKVTNSARTATEQLLISEAVSRSLPKQIDLALPMPKGAVVKLEVTGLTPDKDLAKGLVAGWLGLLGYTVQDGPENAVNSAQNFLRNFFGYAPVAFFDMFCF